MKLLNKFFKSILFIWKRIPISCIKFCQLRGRIKKGVIFFDPTVKKEKETFEREIVKLGQFQWIGKTLKN
jgi:hypothetical protein